MTWGKMDDKFHRNRKVRELVRMKGGREALGTWTFWWSWCLDDPDLTGVVPDFELDAADRRSAKLLVQVGLWDEVDGGYAFHDFTEYNPTREQREAKKEADRSRVASKRAASRTNVARDTDATTARVASESPPARVPDPTRPDPTRPESAHARAHEAEPVPPPDVEAPDRPGAALHRAYVAELAKRTARHDTPTPDKLGAAAIAERDLAETASLRRVAPETLIATALDRWFADPWAKSKGYPFAAFAKQAAQLATSAGEPTARASPGRARGMAPPTSHEDFARIVAENGGKDGIATLTFD